MSDFSDALRSAAEALADASEALADAAAAHDSQFPDGEPEPEEWTLAHTVTEDDPYTTLVLDVVESTAWEIKVDFTPGPGPMPGDRGEFLWMPEYDSVHEQGVNRNLFALGLWTRQGVRGRAGLGVPHESKATLEITGRFKSLESQRITFFVNLASGEFVMEAFGQIKRAVQFPVESAVPFPGPLLLQAGGENPWIGSRIEITARRLP